MSKELGQRSDAELEAMFGGMYSGWDRGVNVTQERFWDGETRFTETPMTPLELAARYVAAEIGANIYEIANRAAFAPITVFSQIQARIGPVFDEAATALEAKEAEIAALRERVKELDHECQHGMALIAESIARAETAERWLGELLAIIHRDGGHYVAKHGFEKSVRDAHLVWSELQRERDEARGHREGVKMRCYIFDIDGTLADCSHRLHHIQKHPKDWDGFFGDCHLDAPHDHIIGLAKDLYGRSVIVFVSGRSDQCRAQTEDWLLNQGLPSGPLYMRKAGDHRDDDVIKLELLEQVKGDGFEPVMVFDDRNRVVKAWRAAGVPCAQVAEGEF